MKPFANVHTIVHISQNAHTVVVKPSAHVHTKFQVINIFRLELKGSANSGTKNQVIPIYRTKCINKPIVFFVIVEPNTISIKKKLKRKCN